MVFNPLCRFPYNSADFLYQFLSFPPGHIAMISTLPIFVSVVFLRVELFSPSRRWGPWLGDVTTARRRVDPRPTASALFQSAICCFDKKENLYFFQIVWFVTFSDIFVFFVTLVASFVCRLRWCLLVCVLLPALCCLTLASWLDTMDCFSHAPDGFRSGSTSPPRGDLGRRSTARIQITFFGGRLKKPARESL
jgi:hypothetical protein